MKYRLTPINIASILGLIVILISTIGGGMGLLCSPFVIAGFVIDLPIQIFIKKYNWILVLEISLLALSLLVLKITGGFWVFMDFSEKFIGFF